MTPHQDGLPALPEPAMKASEGVCCGNFSGGAEYMGQQETICCGQPDEAWPDYFTADQMHAYALAARALPLPVQGEAKYCDECGCTHAPGENTLCPTWAPTPAAQPATVEPLNSAGETPTQHAHRWATELACSLAKKHYPEADNFAPLPDLLGVIMQIDNMTTGLTRAAPPVAAPEATDHIPDAGKMVAGFVLMPVVPTEEMLSAGKNAVWIDGQDGESFNLTLDEAEAVYRAAIAARPSPPAAPAEPADERAAFEAWGKKFTSPLHLHLFDREDDHYEEAAVRISWCAWQARAATPAAPSMAGEGST